MRLGASCLLIVCGIVSATEGVIGWRNDGSGKFPNAEPPLTWSRASKAVKTLRYQAKKPEGSDAGGKEMPGGVIREWLILGPVAIPDVPKPFEKDTVADELQLAPNEGDKLENQTWKKVELETSTLDFTAKLGQNQKSFAYATTNIYSENGGAFTVSFTHRSAARLIFNGKQVYASAGTSGARVSLPMQKGWNRLTMKIGSDLPADQRANKDDFQCWASSIIYAHTPNGYDETNIAWTAPLPGSRIYFGTPAGPGGPIVVGDKIFVLCEPHDLFCLNKADGKVLWIRSNSYFDALTAEEKNSNPAFKEIEPLAAQWEASNAEFLPGHERKMTFEQREKLEKSLYDAMKKIDPKRFNRPNSQDVGYAGFTPVSDGKFIYVWLASGVSACYDLDGNRKWSRIDNHVSVEHGFSSSPALINDKLVVFMREMMAFDAKTGAEVWRNPIVGPTGENPEGWFHGSHTGVRIGNTDLVITPNGAMIRASDGKILYSDPKLGSKQSVASPVVDGGSLFLMSTWSDTFFNVRLPETVGEKIDAPAVSQLRIPTSNYPYFYLNWHIASPVAHEGLVYLMNTAGVLTVLDQKTTAVVYQKPLDIDHFEGPNEGPVRGHGISPVLAGKHLYFFGNNGAAVVIEPGREFKQLAKNKIEGLSVPGTWGERQDRVVANPFFDGKRIYYRTETGLYAIEQK